MDVEVIKELKCLILKQVSKEDLEVKLSVRDLINILDMLLFIICKYNSKKEERFNSDK